jgi:hypothetical protein
MWFTAVLYEVNVYCEYITELSVHVPLAVTTVVLMLLAETVLIGYILRPNEKQAEPTSCGYCPERAAS